MTIGLLLALAVQSLDVQVLSTGTGQGIRAKVTVEENGEELMTRQTSSNGRVSFNNVTCSDDIRLWARAVEPSHPNPSARRTCRAPVTLKVRPTP